MNDPAPTSLHAEADDDSCSLAGRRSCSAAQATRASLRPDRKRRAFARFGGIVAVVLATSWIGACGSTGPTQDAGAGPVRVMTSGGFTSTFRAVVPAYEQSAGARVEAAYGASMGNAPDSIPVRLARNEPVDVVILARPALDELVEQGLVVPGSQIDLVKSDIGMAVRKDSPKPDISTVDSLRSTLLAAQSIAYSASASGTYYAEQLVEKLGIADQVMPKSRRIVSERVGSVVARGDAELGVQQVSELLPIEGITFIGRLPPAVQKTTIFSAGVAAHSTNPEGGRALIRYLASPAIHQAIERNGLEPAVRK